MQVRGSNLLHTQPYQLNQHPHMLSENCSFPALHLDCNFHSHIGNNMMFTQAIKNPTCVSNTNYQLPNGPVKAGRRWGQRHPQGANLGSNGILKFLSKTHTISSMHACTSDPYIPPITVARHAGDPLNPVSHSIWLCHDHSVTISPSNAGGHTQTK